MNAVSPLPPPNASRNRTWNTPPERHKKWNFACLVACKLGFHLESWLKVASDDRILTQKFLKVLAAPSGPFTAQFVFGHVFQKEFLRIEQTQSQTNTERGLAAATTKNNRNQFNGSRFTKRVVGACRAGTPKRCQPFSICSSIVAAVVWQSCVFVCLESVFHAQQWKNWPGSKQMWTNCTWVHDKTEEAVRQWRSSENHDGMQGFGGAHAGSCRHALLGRSDIRAWTDQWAVRPENPPVSFKVWRDKFSSTQKWPCWHQDQQSRSTWQVCVEGVQSVFGTDDK